MKKVNAYGPTLFMGPQIILVAGVKRPHGAGEKARYDIMPLCVDRATAEAFINNKLMPVNGAN